MLAGRVGRQAGRSARPAVAWRAGQVGRAAEAWRADEGRAVGEGHKKTAPEKEPLWVLVAFVGVTRLELATSRPPDAYSNQLSYTPRIGPSSGAYFSKALQR